MNLQDFSLYFLSVFKSVRKLSFIPLSIFNYLLLNLFCFYTIIILPLTPLMLLRCFSFSYCFVLTFNLILCFLDLNHIHFKGVKVVNVLKKVKMVSLPHHQRRAHRRHQHHQHQIHPHHKNVPNSPKLALRLKV